MWIFLPTLKKSFTYAGKGLRYTFQHEQNFRIQLCATVLVVFLMIFFRVKAWEVVALTIGIVSVLILEILNTVVERIIDLLKPRLHHYSELIKDMMAAVVLLASFGAIIIGAIIFVPYILRMVS